MGRKQDKFYQAIAAWFTQRAARPKALKLCNNPAGVNRPLAGLFPQGLRGSLESATAATRGQPRSHRRTDRGCTGRLSSDPARAEVRGRRSDCNLRRSYLGNFRLGGRPSWCRLVRTRISMSRMSPRWRRPASHRERVAWFPRFRRCEPNRGRCVSGAKFH